MKNVRRKKFITKKMTPGEFLDRFTVMVQKAFHSEDYKKRLKDFIVILNKNGFDGELLKTICELQMFNVDIWITEDDIRKRKEGTLGLAEVGVRALRIRNCNTERLERVNRLNKLLGEKKQEEKFNYISDAT